MVRYPSLYRSIPGVLRELGSTLGRSATLADIPDDFLDQVAAPGLRLCLVFGPLADRISPGARSP